MWMIIVFISFVDIFSCPELDLGLIIINSVYYILWHHIHIGLKVILVNG